MCPKRAVTEYLDNVNMIKYEVICEGNYTTII